jgi:hypothetical protein
MSKQNKHRHHFFRRKRKGGGGQDNNGGQGQQGGQPGFQQGQQHSGQPQGQQRFQGGGRGPRLRVAFELDETLGMPITNGRAITGFQLRPGAADLLAHLKQQHELVLWTVGSRSHVNKCLSFGLNKYFQKTFSWDEMPDRWKDVRKTQVDYLVDSSEEHRELAHRVNLESKYILVPAYGSPEDEKDPTLWAHMVGDLLAPKPVPAPPAPPMATPQVHVEAPVAVAVPASQPEPEPQPNG